MSISPTRDHWRIDGYDIKTTGVRITPVSGSTSKKTEWSITQNPGAASTIQRIGSELAEREMQFDLRRPANGDYWAVAKDIVDRLTTNPIVYLHAPTLATSTPFLNQKLAWVIPEEVVVLEHQGKGKLSVRLKMLVLGVPEAYGGTARRTYHGTFEKVSGGWRDDAGTVFASNPWIELPEQRSGWPLAVRRSDNLLVVPPAISPGGIRTENQPVGDGSGARRWQLYNLADFVRPIVTTLGDVGTFEIHSNPTADWFEWGS